MSESKCQPLIPNRVEGSDVAEFLRPAVPEARCELCGTIAEVSGPDAPQTTPGPFLGFVCGSPACQKRAEGRK